LKTDTILKEFQDYLESCHCSPRTVETYGGYAKRFAGFLKEHYLRITSFDRVSKDIILDFQSYLAHTKDRRGQCLSNSTQSLILRSVKKFFRFLIKRDLILKDPTTVITCPKEEQRITRKILSENEVLDLLNATKPRDPLSIRNRAIIELFYACGIRTSELCNLRVQDVDLKEQTVTIMKGKGGKSRILPIGQYCTHYLELYLERARKHMLKGKPQDPGFLFLSQRGRPFNKSTINATVIKSVVRNAKLKKPISAYSFRHTVATHLLAHKVDIMYISKLLGHASLNTTQKYLRVEIGDLKKMHALYHPRENLDRPVPES